MRACARVVREEAQAGAQTATAAGGRASEQAANTRSLRGGAAASGAEIGASQGAPRNFGCELSGLRLPHPERSRAERLAGSAVRILRHERLLKDCAMALALCGRQRFRLLD